MLENSKSKSNLYRLISTFNNSILYEDDNIIIYQMPNDNKYYIAISSLNWDIGYYYSKKDKALIYKFALPPVTYTEIERLVNNLDSGT